MNNVELSVLSPCYNEEENLPRLYDELTRMLVGMGITYEIILVENGSQDNSMTILENLAREDPHVKIVQLSRNFTYQGGISAGMAYASGNFLISIDADLQDPVDLIPEMYEKAMEGDYDIVYGIRKSRQEGLLQKAAYKTFYRMMKMITPFDVPLDAGDFALINRQVLDAILGLPEKNRFLRGLRAWVGFKSTGIPYDRLARAHGKSKFSIADQFGIAFQGLFSFSFLPLRMLFHTGVFICLMIVPLVAMYIVWRALAPNAWPAGTATIIILLLVQIGLTMAGVGLIGEYLAIIFEETKRRPSFITKKLVNLDKSAEMNDGVGR